MGHSRQFGACHKGVKEGKGAAGGGVKEKGDEVGYHRSEAEAGGQPVAQKHSGPRSCIPVSYLYPIPAANPSAPHSEICPSPPVIARPHPSI